VTDDTQALITMNERPRSAMLPPRATDEIVIALWLRKFKKSPNTISAYRADVERFQAFVQKPLAQITLQDLYDYADSLEALEEASQVRFMASVKSLFSFAYKMGYLPFNVGAAYQLEKPPDTLALRILSEEQVMQMVLDEPDPRNQLILRILYSAGLRVSELCALKWEHLQPNGDSGQITVLQGKRRKTRHIVLKPETYRLLKDYRGSSPDDQPIFLSHMGKPLDRSAVWRIIEKAAVRAEIATYQEMKQDKKSGRMLTVTRSKVSPHWLRHAHASHYIARGGDLAVLRDTLGHADFTMSSRYTHARPGQSSSLKLPL
jgi:integrase/recombinase XerD